MGFPFLSILVGLAALGGLWEFYNLARTKGAQISLPLGAIWTVLFIANGQLAGQEGNFAPVLIGSWLLAAFTWALFKAKRFNGNLTLNWLFTAAGPLYLGLLLSHVLILRESGDSLYDGRAWLLYAFIATISCDTGAFFVGRAIGRFKLAPTISPNKTWEGAIGGLVSAILSSLVLAAIFDLGIAIWCQVLLGLVVGIVAQLGDLSESALKRAVHVKDASSLIPGHGGILDRVDSLVVTIPVTYYFLAIIIS